MATIRFPEIHGRSYGYRSTAETGDPDNETGARGNLPAIAGGWAASFAASLRKLGGRSGSDNRDFINRTADDLDTGPAPRRIDHGRRANDRGKIGTSATRDGEYAFPYDASWMLIPHKNIPRVPITVTPFARTIDTSVTVPSVGVGNPVR